jgi:serine/threonine protein kinase
MNESFRRQINILKTLNHLLVVQIRNGCPGANGKRPAVGTGFIANGSLQDDLPDTENHDLCQLNGSTRIMRIIAGIVLAMRFLHSQNIIHADLMPENILLDWTWKVRICCFHHSVSSNQPKHWTLIDSKGMVSWPGVISRCTGPEMNEGRTALENDVFLIWDDSVRTIVRRPVLPRGLNPCTVALALIMSTWRLNIPDIVLPVTELRSPIAQ